MNFLLVKFGKREHLQSLVGGNLFLKAVDEYRQVADNYRGDSWEGKIPVDPSSITIRDSNGNNIFDYIPRPASVMLGAEGDGGVPIFLLQFLIKK